MVDRQFIPEDETEPVQLTVLGVYTRGKTNTEEGPNSVPENSMLRRRIRTRPLLGRHLNSINHDYETARFVPGKGLVNATFYNTDFDKHSVDKPDPIEDGIYPTYKLNTESRIYEERAILLQSYEHYHELATNPQTSNYFDSMRDANGYLQEGKVLERPVFGEQIIVKGMDNTKICIGDVFAFVDDSSKAYSGDSSSLVIEVTSPRLCRAEGNRKSSSPFRNRGLRRHANIYGLGGWFVRVLNEGQVRDGMTFHRVSHPHPKWTLACISMALYGECEPTYMDNERPQWNRSKEDLIALCSIKQLGWYGWKNEAQWILDRWHKIEAEKLKKSEDAVGAKLAALQERDPSAWNALKTVANSDGAVYGSTLVGLGLFIAQQWHNISNVGTAPMTSSFMQVATNSTTSVHF